MRKIDVHTHILPAELPDLKARFGYGGFIVIDKSKKGGGATLRRDDGTFFRDVERNCFDPARRLEEMDETGVDLQVLSTVPVMFSYWAKPKDGLALSRLLNDHIAGVVAGNPRRFAGLGTLPLQSPKDAVAELERCVKIGLCGVQIGTNVGGKNLDEPALFPVFEAAADLGAAVFIHPWDMLGGERMKKYWLPWLVGMPAELSLAVCSLIFSGVLERLPKLRVAFAHGGGAFGGTLGRIERGFLARPDLCAVDNKVNPRSYLGRLYVDSCVGDARTLSFLIELFGAGRVALGSDYPFPLGEEIPGALIESLSLPKDEKERLLSGAALSWLGRTKEAARAL